MGKSNRLKIRVLEEAGATIPKGAGWQERQVKKIYQAANIGRKIEGLPRRTYYLLDSKGRLVPVE